MPTKWYSQSVITTKHKERNKMLEFAKEKYSIKIENLKDFVMMT